ncbi:MAG TPA: DUF3343 domain-containing protein [Coriobacteriia bacterium]
MTGPARSFAVLGFATTHDALAAEALLKDLGVAAVPIPAPLALGSLCGIALRLEHDDVERAVELLANAGVAVTGRAAIDDV